MICTLNLPIASDPILDFGVIGLGISAENIIFEIHKQNNYNVYKSINLFACFLSFKRNTPCKQRLG